MIRTITGRLYVFMGDSPTSGVSSSVLQAATGAGGSGGGGEITPIDLDETGKKQVTPLVPVAGFSLVRIQASARRTGGSGTMKSETKNYVGPGGSIIGWTTVQDTGNNTIGSDYVYSLDPSPGTLSVIIQQRSTGWAQLTPTVTWTANLTLLAGQGTTETNTAQVTLQTDPAFSPGGVDFESIYIAASQTDRSGNTIISRYSGRTSGAPFAETYSNGVMPTSGVDYNHKIEVTTTEIKVYLNTVLKHTFTRKAMT